MKTLLKTNVILLLGIVALWGCEEDVTPLQHTAPQVTFPVQETSLTAVVGDPVEFRADIESGDKLTCGWYVDGTLEASTAEMTYTFSAPGDYEVRFEARNGAGKVEKSYAVKVADVLKMHLSVGDSTRIVRRQLDVLKVMAVVDAGSDVVHEWKVDGEVKSDKAYFDTFDLPEAKVYTVAYAGTNAAGTFRKSFEVQATERPLEIGFSNNDETIACKDGAVVEIIATVKYGGTGLVHAWKVGDEVVSTTAEFRHTFDAAGTYAVTYEGVNAKGEKKNASWTVEVSEDAVGYMFENFESRDALPGHFINGNAAIEGTTLQENPYKTAVNPSNKVLRDLLLKESGTSGYFDMGFSHLTDRSKYRAIRVKVYLGKNLYYPRMQINVLPDGKKNKLPSKINGQPFTSSMKEADWKALIKTDDWNVFVYDLIDCGYQNADGSAVTNFGDITAVQFRPLSNFTGGSMSGRDEETNNRTVYYDDFEFLE